MNELPLAAERHHEFVHPELVCHLDALVILDLPAMCLEADSGRVLGRAAPLGSVVTEIHPDDVTEFVPIATLNVVVRLQDRLDGSLEWHVLRCPRPETGRQCVEGGRIDAQARAQREAPGDRSHHQQDDRHEAP